MTLPDPLEPLAPANDGAADQAPSTVASAVRFIEPLDLSHPLLKDLQLRPIATAEPIYEKMDPADLMVDEAYQRNLTDKSVNLIRKIVEGWDWRRFKPPIVAMTERGFEVVDGQHTAIGALMRGISELPVMVIDAGELTARAASFVGHNADRLAVDPTVLYFAGLISGQEKYLQIKRVCDRSGVTIVKKGGSRAWQVGDTVAVQVIASLIDRRGEGDAERVLSTLAAAQAAPISAPAIKAVAVLYFDEEYADKFEDEELVKTILLMSDRIERQSKTFAASHYVPLWKGMASSWYLKVKLKKGERR